MTKLLPTLAEARDIKADYIRTRDEYFTRCGDERAFRQAQHLWISSMEDVIDAYKCLSADLSKYVANQDSLTIALRLEVIDQVQKALEGVRDEDYFG